jgi:hypothetical protein
MTEAKPKSNATLIVIVCVVAGALLLVPCVLGGIALVTGGLLLNRAADTKVAPTMEAVPPLTPTEAAPPEEAPATPY